MAQYGVKRNGTFYQRKREKPQVDGRKEAAGDPSGLFSGLIPQVRGSFSRLTTEGEGAPPALPPRPPAHSGNLPPMENFPIVRRSAVSPRCCIYVYSHGFTRKCGIMLSGYSCRHAASVPFLLERHAIIERALPIRQREAQAAQAFARYVLALPKVRHRA